MNQPVSPREIVDRQLVAYNRGDLEAYCALFSVDAVTSVLPAGEPIARGIDAIRAFYTTRFQTSNNLHCTILARIELGEFVIDHEEVAGIAAEPLQLIAIYEVRDALIRSLRLIWPQ